MKTVLLSITLVCTLLDAATQPATVIESPDMTQIKKDKELIWVDEHIQAILPARVGISDGFINSLSDPMKLKRAASPAVSKTGTLLPPPKLGSLACPPVPKIVEEPLRLKALMNQNALINGKWYRVNDQVRQYTLTEIKSNSVLLSGKKDQKLILFLTKPNTNIQINTK